jgi:hypothetical protein
MPGSSEFNAMDSGMRRNDGLISGSLASDKAFSQISHNAPLSWTSSQFS